MRRRRTSAPAVRAGKQTATSQTKRSVDCRPVELGGNVQYDCAFRIYTHSARAQSSISSTSLRTIRLAGANRNAIHAPTSSVLPHPRNSCCRKTPLCDACGGKGPLAQPLGPVNRALPLSTTVPRRSISLLCPEPLRPSQLSTRAVRHIVRGSISLHSTRVCQSLARAFGK